MKMTDTTVLQKVVRTCNDGWLQGWHERNGGNLSYRMSEAEVDQCLPFFQPEPGAWMPMPVTAANLAG
ncbi:MAG: rhamnulose-1-phosphate aldolase, partial [Eubacteriales bacterium]|nr:rhamnulose-1-phosphate aldolase [Eubacteriales bacterium]